MVFPIETWPSPATATWSRWRTATTVVASKGPEITRRRRAPLAAPPEVAVGRARRPVPEGNDPLLPPFAQHAHGLPGPVHVIHVQAGQLRHAQPRRVQELEDRHVPLARGAADRLAVHQHLRLIDRQERHELASEARAANLAGHVAGEHPPANEEAEPAP